MSETTSITSIGWSFMILAIGFYLGNARGQRGGQSIENVDARDIYQILTEVTIAGGSIGIGAAIVMGSAVIGLCIFGAIVLAALLHAWLTSSASGTATAAPKVVSAWAKLGTGALNTAPLLSGTVAAVIAIHQSTAGTSPTAVALVGQPTSPAPTTILVDAPIAPLPEPVLPPRPAAEPPPTTGAAPRPSVTRPTREPDQITTESALNPAVLAAMRSAETIRWARCHLTRCDTDTLHATITCSIQNTGGAAVSIEGQDVLPGQRTDVSFTRTLQRAADGRVVADLGDTNHQHEEQFTPDMCEAVSGTAI